MHGRIETVSASFGPKVYFQVTELFSFIFGALDVGGACCDAAGAASPLEMGHRDFSVICVCRRQTQGCVFRVGVWIRCEPLFVASSAPSSLSATCLSFVHWLRWTDLD